MQSWNELSLFLVGILPYSILLVSKSLPRKVKVGFSVAMGSQPLWNLNMVVDNKTQVLSRRDELNQDLLLQTCSFTVIPGQERRSSSFSEVSPESGHFCPLSIQISEKRGHYCPINVQSCELGIFNFDKPWGGFESKKKTQFGRIEARNFQFTMGHSKEDLEYQRRKALQNRKGLETLNMGILYSTLHLT